MKKDKILLNVSSLSCLDDYRSLGISNFLFPLKDFSIGYRSFTFEQIESSHVQAFVLVNRILTDEDIDAFLNLRIPTNVVGFIIEDIGLYYALKDSKYKLINFQNHLNNNYKTVNFWLRHFDSLVLSTDLTYEEVKEILDEANKPLVLTVMAFPMIMYSRRFLVSNYRKHYGLEGPKELEITEDRSSIDFKLVESDYGTAVFDNNLVDVRKEALSYPDEKVLFYLIDTNFISKSDVIRAISNLTIDNTTKGFLYKKTVYRVGDIK